MINILVVEDDAKLNQIVCTYLNDNGFHTKGCLNAKEAYDEMYNNLYELIISDIMMPEIDGFEFARTVRQINRTIPILFMSAKDDLLSKQRGFQLGIDDYMVKPIELDELLLRVRALLRRANIETERKIIVGNLVLDADGMSAEIGGEEIGLTTREFNIIYKLFSYPKKTFSRAQIMIPMVYWGIVAVGLTLFTRQKMRSTYEEPLHKMAEASRKVSEGDFSVYVPTIHTVDKLDYLDVMILDFNKMVEELGSIETLKTDFVSNVSHEMKTPIAIIKNYAELLLADRIEDEQRKEYAGSVESAVTRLSELISNVLKLNKLENRKIMPEMEN